MGARQRTDDGSSRSGRGPVPIGKKCAICERVWMHNERRWRLSKRGLCPVCEDLAELCRRNIEAAQSCGRKPPDPLPPCEICGGPTEDPILWRPDADWDCQCVKGCYYCKTCERVVPSYETCPHDPRKKRRRAKRE